MKQQGIFGCECQYMCTLHVEYFEILEKQVMLLCQTRDSDVQSDCTANNKIVNNCSCSANNKKAKKMSNLWYVPHMKLEISIILLLLFSYLLLDYRTKSQFKSRQ